MRFTFEGQNYSIEFSRDFKEVTPFASGKTIKSKYPYTTVRVLKDVPTTPTSRGWELVRTATVGVFPTDKFTHEKGRINALRLVSKTLDKPFKKVMWKAYIDRARG